MQNQIHLIKSKRFLPLFITQFFGAFNDNAFKNAFLIWFTYDVTIESGMDASIVVPLAAGLFVLPFFLFSATAGQLADKYERSWLTKKIKQVEILLMIGCAICFFAKSIFGLLVILFFMGAQSAFFGPIKYSLLPEHLKKEELIGGNGLIGGGTFLSILLGTIFGGLVIRTEYGVAVLSICLISFAVIGWFGSRYIPKASIGSSNLTIGWNIFSKIWPIIGYARKESSVWLSIIGISWFWLIGALFLIQFPIYTKEIIKGNEHVVTFFLTIFSVGIGIGSVWCNRLLKGEINGRLVPYGSIGMSVAIMFFVIASFVYSTEYMQYIKHSTEHKSVVLGFTAFLSMGLSSWWIVLSLLMLSVCGGIYIVPFYAIMQHRSDACYIARVIAANNIMNALFMVIASVLALVLFALQFTVTGIVFLVGVINILVFFIVRRLIK